MTSNRKAKQSTRAHAHAEGTNYTTALRNQSDSADNSLAAFTPVTATVSKYWKRSDRGWGTPTGAGWVAEILGPDGSFKGQFDTGPLSLMRLEHDRRTPYPVGSIFTVVLRVHADTDYYTETFTFRVTQNPNDEHTAWTGPGISDEPAAEGALTKPGFEYGVQVTGAVLLGTSQEPVGTSQ